MDVTHLSDAQKDVSAVIWITVLLDRIDYVQSEGSHFCSSGSCGRARGFYSESLLENSRMRSRKT